MTRRALRATFDVDAARYDRARPGYPDALFDDLQQHADIGPRTLVVEIGPGTGQATARLAAAGAHVVTVDLGAELAATLHRKVPAVEVVVSPFEDWRPPERLVDTVAAFISWHWVDPGVRAAAVAAALRPASMLATRTPANRRRPTSISSVPTQAIARWTSSTAAVCSSASPS